MKFRRRTSYVLVLLIASLLVANVIAYPNAPGTCHLDLMATIGHGPSKSTCDDCYRIKVARTTPMTITIHGPNTRPYQGILIQVKDERNQTIGSFVDYDENAYAPVACEEQEAESEDATLGHVDAKPKHWPVTLRWTTPHPAPVARVQGIVVLDYDNFHLFPETSFKPIAQPPKHTFTTATTAVTDKGDALQATPTVEIIEEEDDEIILPEPESLHDPNPNPLFIQVLVVVLILYFFMAVFRFEWQRRRRRNQQKEDVLMDEDEALTISIKDH
ncbi:hypothetical protein BCR43DRAFT_492702 [Syncephalastrum racemosum]|uniref:Reelin domain-containing protein n=1 Tax=Syncephalastrum racemosum TaxID=13706 RepID=A0A1X2H9F2_SYNRA|nr:hypothetical protein BCR43DRAFT_492702 [Syncephalastrum racemosum]